MRLTARSLHRDFAFFYLGLLIAFSLSGIILNHRKDWYPRSYTYDQKELSISLPPDREMITKEFIASFSKAIDPQLEYEGHRIRKGTLRVYYRGDVVLDLQLENGAGTLEYKRRVPLLGHTIDLHKSTSGFWVWYSDIFGASMLLIAITGVLIPVGKYGWKGRGWKLATAGMLFPLIFLFLLS